MEENKVLNTVVENLGYELLKDVLVKPLPVIMITKEITEPVVNGEKDEEGYDTYDTETETKKVESDFRTGIVLAMPIEVSNINDSFSYKFAVGDTVVYASRCAKNFDLFKDSQLVRPYDIIAKVK